MAVACTFGSSCQRREPNNATSAHADTAQSTGTRAPTVAEIAEQAQRAVVIVETPSGLGTGFAIAPGIIATNLHVVAGADSITLHAAKTRKVRISGVVGVDPEHDLALLQYTEPIDLRPLVLGDDSSLRAGDGVVAVGTPQGLELSVSTGIIAAVRNATPNLTLLQITAPISTGSSGGPLFDANGHVVGVTTLVMLRGQNLNFAVPARYLKSLLSQRNQPLGLREFAQLRFKDIRTRRASTRPPFPRAVAGFNLGWTLAVARDACPGKLKEANNRAECSIAPVDVPFASGGVRLFLYKGRIIAVELRAQSLEDVTTALSSKYGPPDTAWDPKEDLLNRRLEWKLDGGTIVVRHHKKDTYHVNYVSDSWDAESNY
jgi:S1-C subfamily serine protease